MSGAQFIPESIKPTVEQLAIQVAQDNTVVIEANAGSAKTTTLALRLAESWRRGVRPQQCLALTYTDTAQHALLAALHKLGVPKLVASQFQIRTFESFAASVLLALEGRPVVSMSPDNLKPYVWQAIDAVAGNEFDRWRDELLIPSNGDNIFVEEFLRESLHLKGTMQLETDENPGRITPEYAESMNRGYTQLKVFRAYEKIRRGGHPDYPGFRGPFDATYDLAKLIYENEVVDESSAWPKSIKVLVVDEMHDINQATFFILNKLLSAHSVFFCGVGDADQVIHSAAGADQKYMERQIEESTNRRVTRFPLTSSFRFDANLAGLAGRFKKKQFSSGSTHSTVVTSRVCPVEDCASLIVSEIKTWLKTSTGKSQFVVLLRHPHQSIALENAFLEADLPYGMLGFDSYLMRPEILLVRGLLAIAADRFTSIAHEDTRRKIVEAFVFFSNAKLVVEGKEHMSQREVMESAIKEISIAPSLLTSFFENQIVRNTDESVASRLLLAIRIAQTDAETGMLHRFFDALQIGPLSSTVIVEKQRREDAVRNLEGLTSSASRYKTTGDFFQSLNDAELKQRGLKNASTILLASAVTVKGLEFDNVAIPYLRKGEFPAPDSIGTEDENLFYVAMTRARKSLSLYWDQDLPSTFLDRVG